MTFGEIQLLCSNQQCPKLGDAHPSALYLLSVLVEITSSGNQNPSDHRTISPKTTLPMVIFVTAPSFIIKNYGSSKNQLYTWGGRGWCPCTAKWIPLLSHKKNAAVGKENIENMEDCFPYTRSFGKNVQGRAVTSQHIDIQFYARIIWFSVALAIWMGKFILQPNIAWRIIQFQHLPWEHMENISESVNQWLFLVPF